MAIGRKNPAWQVSLRPEIPSITRRARRQLKLLHWLPPFQVCSNQWTRPTSEVWCNLAGKFLSAKRFVGIMIGLSKNVWDQPFIQAYNNIRLVFSSLKV